MLESIKKRKTGDQVFIIGGGPSLKKYLPNPRILDGKDIICCNNGFELFPNALATAFMDVPWFTNNKERMKEVFKGTTIMANSHRRKEFMDEIDIVMFRGPNKGISEAPDKVCGSNTGH